MTAEMLLSARPDLSSVTLRSRHALVRSFCLSQKVNVWLKARLKRQVRPQVTTNSITCLWRMTFIIRGMYTYSCCCHPCSKIFNHILDKLIFWINLCLGLILILISTMTTLPYLTRLLQNLVNWGWLRCIRRESSWSAREVFSDVSSVFA